MRRGADNEDVALQPRPAREFASKLFVLKLKGVMRLKKKVRNIMLSATVLFLGGGMFFNDRNHTLREYAAKTFYPTMYYSMEEKAENDWNDTLLKSIIPLYDYMSDNTPPVAEVEDHLTYEMILLQQENDEYTMSEEVEVAAKDTVTPQTTDTSIEKLRDFNYLLSKFYTVDSTTTIGPEQLNVDDLLSRNMQIDNKKSGPKILIFHTHSQEAFADSKSGDSNTSIVGMGRYLSELLNAKGIETLHHNGVYDLINGKLDRSKAYQMAEAGVKEILNQNPSIEVVIDLHRDGVPETTHLVTDVNGKKTAKIMFFNGLSRTKKNGDIAYLPNPYIQDNLSFSFQMQMASEKLYPGFARRIYLKGYRYSLHMMPKSLLIEAGAQTNTVEEMKNSMELLANILVEVLL